MTQSIAKTTKGPIEYRLEGSGPTVLVLNGSHCSRESRLSHEGLTAYQATLHGIEALPLSILSLEQVSRGALLLGFAAIDENQLNTSVGQLAAALLNYSPKN